MNRPWPEHPQHGFFECEICAVEALHRFLGRLCCGLIALVAVYWLVLVARAWSTGAIERLVTR